MKKVVILGSTGSIGTQAVDVCQKLGYKVLAISAHNNIRIILKQARELLPRYVVLTDKIAFDTVSQSLEGSGIEVLFGNAALCKLAVIDDCDIVLNALSGIVGLEPTLLALQAGNTVALANKEALVAGGRLVVDAARRGGGTIIPVDSEHTAIFQCIQGEKQNKIKKIILTASGGPFLGKTKEELLHVGMAEALNHPKWNMGRKITVDSATLMNKGLEFIECIWNFGVTPDEIEVVVHPQTVIHSAVEFVDGSIMAQMSTSDMRLPIQYALTYPNRCQSSVEPLEFTKMGNLTFMPPDLQAFPCLALAISAIKDGGLAPCVLNGANEVAVQSFLNGEIQFHHIAEVVADALSNAENIQDYSLEQVLAADRAARESARKYISCFR